MKVCVAQIGARRHYAVPAALHRAGLLSALHTDWCANRGFPRLIAAALPSALAAGRLRRLHDRRIPELPRASIETHQWHAIGMFRLRQRLRSNESYWEHANAAFGRSVVKRGFNGADTVYAFNAAAVEIFEAASRLGLRTVLDQTMAPWQTVESLLAEERRRWPQWESAGTEGDPTGLLADRESQEWTNADLIVCGSEYVAETVAAAGGPAERCRVVPYGYDGPTLPPKERPTPDGPLRVLFIGTVDLRKGLPYLLEAAERIDRRTAEFRVVGPLRVNETIVQRLRRRVDVVGPVPRSDVGNHYRWADVFVLPTLAEGSANVCYEAMAHGLPVITTPNAGSVVRNEIDGWIIPIRSSDAIADRLEHLAAGRDQLCEASHHARQRAGTFTWDRYMQTLAETVSAVGRCPRTTDSLSTVH